MLVLIQVSSMKTSRRGSRPACQDRQRRRRRAMSARACSRANSVFFEPQPLAPQEQPYRIVRHLHALAPPARPSARAASDAASGDPLHDEGTMRLEHRACDVHPSGPAPPSRSHDSAATTSPPRTPQHRNRVATDRQLSPAKTAATTRSRRSLERGRLIRCWPPSQPAS